MEEIIENTESVESTEIMESYLEETPQETETVVVVDDTQTVQLLTQIYNDVHIIMVISILTFCSACLRGWRKNVTKGVS